MIVVVNGVGHLCGRGCVTWWTADDHIYLGGGLGDEVGAGGYAAEHYHVEGIGS